MYKLKNINDRVNCLMRAGKDFVKTSLPIATARQVIESGTLVKSDKPEYDICVDKIWYFEGEKIIKSKSKDDANKGD